MQLLCSWRFFRQPGPFRCARPRAWAASAALVGASGCYTPKPVTFDGDASADTDQASQDTDPGGGDGSAALAVPPGTIALDASSGGCPPGWTEWLDARGRALVAVADAADAGGLVGDALTTLQPHPHTHTVTADIPLDAAGVGVLSGCCNDTSGHSGAQTASGTLDEGESELPTIGVRLCRRDGDPAQASTGTPFPVGSATFFDRPSCPPGWSALDEAVGRFVIAAPAGAPAMERVGVPLANGEDRTHAHQVTLSVTLPDRSLSAAGGSNTEPAQSGTYEVDAETDPATSGMPYVQALLCRADVPSTPTGAGDEVLPPGLVFWSTEAACANGWAEHERLPGRFVIGLPTGVAAGAIYGEPLVEGEDREHGHTGALSLRVPFASLSILSGCCLGGIGAHGIFDVSVEVEPAPVGLPTIALRACEKG